MNSPTIRALAPSELFQKRFNILTLLRVRFHAKLDLTLFTTALQQTIAQQSLLHSIIEPNNVAGCSATQPAHFVTAPTPPTPLNQVYPCVATAEEAEAIYRDEINTPLDTTTQLFRTVLIPISPTSAHGLADSSNIPSEACDYLFLVIIDHTISDGRSGDAFLVQLFERYHALISNTPTDPAPPMVARSAESFFSEALAKSDPNLVVQAQQEEIDPFKPDSILPHFMTPSSEIPSGMKPTICTQFVTLNPNELAAIKRFCKAEGRKLNHLFSALFIQALYATTATSQLNLACKFAVDLRHLLYNEPSDFDPNDYTATEAPNSGEPLSEQEAATENDLFSCRASIYDGYFSLTPEITTPQLAQQLEERFALMHDRETLLKHLHAFSATTKKSGAHLNTMISNVGQSQLQSEWEHFTIKEYIAHGIAFAPVIGIAMLGFDKQVTFTLYHIAPWIRDDQVATLIEHFKAGLSAYSTYHQENQEVCS